MLTLDVKQFTYLIHSLLDSEMRFRGKRGPLSPESQEVVNATGGNLASLLESLELTVSAKTAKNMLAGCKSQEETHAACQQLFNTVALEVDGRKFYVPLSRYTQYYDQREPFGKDVFNAFPSANEDIYESGMCLALERSTACVLHLFRAHEVALKALANAVGVGPQNDWGKYLGEIDKELTRRMKAAGARTAEEQFYAEAAENFDRLRRAYRNPTMHPEKTYSQERAEEIFIAAKSFMSHLATRISE